MGERLEDVVKGYCVHRGSPSTGDTYYKSIHSQLVSPVYTVCCSQEGLAICDGPGRGVSVLCILYDVANTCHQLLSCGY